MEGRIPDLFTSFSAGGKAGGAVFAALDFETTGLDPRTDRVIEAGIVRFTLEGELECWERYINPGIPIPPDSTRISGIDDAHVAGAPDFFSAAPELLELLEGAVLVAHNLNFDYSFLRSELARMGSTGEFAFGVDTLALARKTLPGRKSYSLQNLAGDLGFSRGRAHRALDDARLCRDLFLFCGEKIPDFREMPVRELCRFAAPFESSRRKK